MPSPQGVFATVQPPPWVPGRDAAELLLSEGPTGFWHRNQGPNLAVLPGATEGAGSGNTSRFDRRLMGPEGRSRGRRLGRHALAMVIKQCKSGARLAWDSCAAVSTGS